MIALDNPAALRAALQPYAGSGHLFQTSVSAETEEMLRQALRIVNRPCQKKGNAEQSHRWPR